MLKCDIIAKKHRKLSMYSDSELSLQDRLNNIATYSTGYHQEPNNLVAEIQAALAHLGFRDFAALTVNNFNIVQKSTSSFAPSDKFFGRDLKAIIENEVLSQSATTRAPVVRPCGLSLNAPFNLVYNNDPEQRHFALFSIFRDRFTHGYVVVFGKDEPSLANALWPLQTIAQVSVDAVRNLPMVRESSVLNANEIKVLKWTYDGKTAKQVAEILDISVRNVNFYIGLAIEKMAAENKSMAARKAKEMGLF